MRDTTPQAVQSCHQLLLWLIPQLDKFPRSRRFTLGERLENALIEVLERFSLVPTLLRGNAYGAN